MWPVDDLISCQCDDEPISCQIDQFLILNNCLINELSVWSFDNLMSCKCNQLMIWWVVHVTSWWIDKFFNWSFINLIYWLFKSCQSDQMTIGNDRTLVKALRIFIRIFCHFYHRLYLPLRQQHSFEIAYNFLKVLRQILN